MQIVQRLFFSSIGRKQIVALTGMALMIFVTGHLVGNLLLLGGPELFNHYAETLAKNPALIPIEFGLATIFLVHVSFAIRLAADSAAARPVGYQYVGSAGARTPGSRTMVFTGIWTLVFLIVHLFNFKFSGELDGENGLYGLVVRHFSHWGWLLYYEVSMVALGLHLSHGFQSVFQTLGLNHPVYTPWLKRLGVAYALIVAGGFMLVPLFCKFVGGSHA